MTTPAQHYQRAAKSLMSARDLEASALLVAASRLQAATAESVKAEEFSAALDHNRRLWSIFAGSVSEASVRLPDDLRLRVLALADFVFNHTIMIAAAKDRTAAGTLVEINRELAAGLRGAGNNQ